MTLPWLMMRGVAAVRTPEPTLDADRDLRALVGCLRARAAIGLIEQVLEFHALALEAIGAHVGDIVGDDFDVALLRRHAGRSDVECFHLLFPSIRR